MKTRLLILFAVVGMSLFVQHGFAEDVALNAYEQLNYRLDIDIKFAQLVQTEVVGFGVDEHNEGIFIVVDPMYASPENLEKYEETFRETIGKDISIKFEIRERGVSVDNKDPDFILLALLIIPVFCITIYYFWRKRK
jgi:hypothetical protein